MVRNKSPSKAIISLCKKNKINYMKGVVFNEKLS